MRSSTLSLAIVASVAFAGSSQSDSRFSPAQYRDGEPPPIQARAVGGGEVFLEVSVTDRGLVDAVRVLRTSPPFTESVVETVRRWRFAPAEEEIELEAGQRRDGGPQIPSRRRTPTPSKVLVGAVFRPPTIHTPTLGEPPKDVASSSEEVPFPSATSMPPYPPNALFDGIVIVEMHVDSDGRVRTARVVRSAGSFDEPALAASKQWRFEPARMRGKTVESVTYVAFAFRQPVTTPLAR